MIYEVRGMLDDEIFLRTKDYNEAKYRYHAEMLMGNLVYIKELEVFE